MHGLCTIWISHIVRKPNLLVIGEAETGEVLADTWMVWRILMRLYSASRQLRH